MQRSNWFHLSVVSDLLFTRTLIIIEVKTYCLPMFLALQIDVIKINEKRNKDKNILSDLRGIIMKECCEVKTLI